MLKYKFNVGEALERAGLNMYKAKTTKVLSQNTLKKIKNEDTSISLDSLNKVCTILNMQPKDIIMYVENEEEKKNLLSKFSSKA
ncbi:helix-turn-helix transcriptional regulator [Blautia sp. JLR.GB0024]|uniref:helix-turn-helix domain-containing protein n=1 Tax=Blautia sp. JLR.GB0024 TaxID=3123295 RepID=UPI00300403F6